MRFALPWDGFGPSRNSRSSSGRGAARQRGSVLIIVLWVAFGLVSLTLYFAHAMTFELRASDNRVAEVEAEQILDGAARYVSYLLSNEGTNGTLLDVSNHPHEGAGVGEGYYWLLGRSDRTGTPEEPFFGLVDEASKLNLNTASVEMLQLLPRMTPQLAAAIVDWRDADEDLTTSGAEAETYARLRPPYKCKNAPFETVEELRLVSGADLELLYGEDTNWNGALDPNENDGNVTLPDDNRDGKWDPGLLEYVTVYSRESNTRTNVNNPQQLAAWLGEKLGADRANQILRRPGVTAGNRSLLEFFIKSQMTAVEFAQVESGLTATNGTYIEGLVNVNTARAAVLTCIPGIGAEHAESLVSYRRSNPDKLASVAWVAEVLERSAAVQAGPYLTARSYQVSADIAAVGHFGRGYRRARFVFDTSEGTAKLLCRQDLSHLGWALGRQARQRLLLAKETR